MIVHGISRANRRGPGLQRRPMQNLARIGLPLLALLLAGCIGAIVSLVGPTQRTTLLMALTAVLATPIVVQAIRRRLDLFEPLTIMCIVLLAMFVGRPISLIVHDQYTHIGYDFAATFDRALVVALIGCVFFVIGYFVPWGRRIGERTRPIAGEWKADAIVKFALGLALLGGLLYSLFLLQSGGITALQSILSGRNSANELSYRQSTGYLYQALSFTVPAALLLLGAGVSRRRPLLFVLAIIVVTPHLIISSALGNRQSMMLALLPMVTFLFLICRRRPGALTTVIALYLTVAVGIGFLGDQRFSEGRTEDRINILADTLVHPNRGIDRLLKGGDTAMFDTLAIMQGVVPGSLPYQHGALVEDIFIRMVPRVLWPDKPLESNDRFVVYLWPGHYELVRASSASSFLGNLYQDSGLFSVAAGMLLTGIFLRGAWAWSRRWADNISVQLAYSALLPYAVVLARGILSGTVALTLFTVLPLFIGFWLARREPARTEEGHADRDLRCLCQTTDLRPSTSCAHGLES